MQNKMLGLKIFQKETTKGSEDSLLVTLVNQQIFAFIAGNTLNSLQIKKILMTYFDPRRMDV
jgi:hypothetical protein